MKNLTNSKARTSGKRDLRRVFRDCKFKDALTVEESEPPTADDFIYYYNKARAGQVESKSLQDTLAKLEEKLTAAGFEVEMDGEDYEPDTRLYHQVIYAAKLYF